MNCAKKLVREVARCRRRLVAKQRVSLLSVSAQKGKLQKFGRKFWSSVLSREGISASRHASRAESALRTDGELACWTRLTEQALDGAPHHRLH
eukprot:4344835-Prymnesium_polylepis.1